MRHWNQIQILSHCCTVNYKFRQWHQYDYSHPNYNNLWCRHYPHGVFDSYSPHKIGAHVWQGNGWKDSQLCGVNPPDRQLSLVCQHAYRPRWWYAVSNHWKKDSQMTTWPLILDSATSDLRWNWSRQLRQWFKEWTHRHMLELPRDRNMLKDNWRGISKVTRNIYFH
jgi:hypothetical protein